jgi:hypothetical protein
MSIYSAFDTAMASAIKSANQDAFNATYEPAKLSAHKLTFPSAHHSAFEVADKSAI